jgi:hypothetical protein
MCASPEVSRERAQRAAHAVLLRLAAEDERQAKVSRRWMATGWLVPAASVVCSALIGISLAMTLPAADADEPIVLGMILDSGSMASGWTVQ